VLLNIKTSVLLSLRESVMHNDSSIQLFPGRSAGLPLHYGLEMRITRYTQGHRKRQGIGPANTPKQLINYSYFVLSMRRARAHDKKALRK